MEEELYAHTGPDADSAWQPLAEHLNNVASEASRFADRFGMGPWGQALGVLHDAGKASSAFLSRLAGSPQSVDHSTAGAKIAVERYGASGMLMAYALAGHHGGMPNGIAQTRGIAGRKSLEARLKAEAEPYDRFFKLIEDGEVTLPDAPQLGLPSIPTRRKACENNMAAQCFSVYVLGRMLHSALVDADYLDAERFMSPDVAAAREGKSRPSIGELRELLAAHLADKMAIAPDTPINRARRVVLEDCRAAAREEPGLFSLTVPTGGGKTLSSLAFALDHAAEHGMDRVILVAPYTAIIEQTAATLKGIFGAGSVLEHHSNYDFDDLDDDERRAQRLAAQNWDAPIIVTTNVQFFESLFACKPGKSRKVHSIARSVVVLDEAQTLPDGLLKPSLAMLEELTLAYGTSVVLCTATQPALDLVWPFGSQPREIVRRTDGFPDAFSGRVSYEVLGTLEVDELVEQLAALPQVLCVVGTKDGARRIYRDLVARARDRGELEPGHTASEEGLFHLSASMTPLHRAAVLASIRARLASDERCVVISTQLVEAGVDVDFPLVYRELAGIDSLVQAAGRCNREGRRDGGIVRVFEYAVDGERRKTVPWLEKMKGIARDVIREHGGIVDESLVRPFFEWRYEQEEALDAKGIYGALSSQNILRGDLKTMPFEQVSHDYRIIEDDTVPLLVPRGEEGRAALAQLMTAANPAAMVMRLQRHSVSIPRRLALDYAQVGATCEVGPALVLREERLEDFYKDDVGLLKPGEEESQPLFF